MLRFVGTLARVMFGWALASLAAGLITVLFVDIDVLSGRTDDLPKTVGETIDLALLAATHIAIFSAIFVLIAAAIGEWFSLRMLSFYLLAGVIIGLLGFTAQYMSEVAGQPTIFNNYAVKAFLTAGLFGGFVYWLAAGQFAGRALVPLPPRGSVPEVAKRSAERNGETVEVIITKPPSVGDEPRWRMPRLERLKFANREAEGAFAHADEDRDAATGNPDPRS
ncbi:MAG: hypothetical protein JSR99_12990 [Proteobacteria bacterium]|nr:hypothetical protein [Pseudomonadota bacterium]